MSQREASRIYGIPRSSRVLKMKALKENNVSAPGRKPVFTMEEEKCYLDRTGRRVEMFVINLLGKRWAGNFLKRHKLGGVITSYIDNLSQVAKNVPPEQLWDYDETNFVDDRGKKLVITKRGC
ncbi:hypothetical protein PR048_002262 [Dryococelus australis]|uniref:HTH psq-type domain-containing protein n=1 Tax=Dryococelus australis TaxID=614101 RepID=A0ABQ9IKS4_9NEOP|nr:hypothetical protein PR048_002262 [Dryococelus australis]